MRDPATGGAPHVGTAPSPSPSPGALRPWERSGAGPAGFLYAALRYLERHSGDGRRGPTTDQVHRAVGVPRSMPPAHTRSGLVELEAYRLVRGGPADGDAERWHLTEAGEQAVAGRADRVEGRR